MQKIQNNQMHTHTRSEDKNGADLPGHSGESSKGKHQMKLTDFKGLHQEALWKVPQK